MEGAGPYSWAGGLTSGVPVPEAQPPDMALVEHRVLGQVPEAPPEGGFRLWRQVDPAVQVGIAQGVQIRLNVADRFQFCLRAALSQPGQPLLCLFDLTEEKGQLGLGEGRGASVKQDLAHAPAHF